MRTREGDPVCVPGSTSTPAACAPSKSVTVWIVPFSTSLDASIRAIVFPTSFFAWSPVDVTTTSSSEYGDNPSVRSATAPSPGFTVTARDTAAYPTALARTVT